MANMTVRSTYALNTETAQSVKRLARTWGVSQAEVIRRSVALAAAQQAQQNLSPAQVVSHYREQALPRNRQQTMELIQSMRDLRHADDTRRGGAQ